MNIQHIRIAKIKCTHIAEYKISAYGSEQFIVEIIDFFRKTNLFMVEQKYCIIGLCIFKYPFNIWQYCDFLLVRLAQLLR